MLPEFDFTEQNLNNVFEESINKDKFLLATEEGQ